MRWKSCERTLTHAGGFTLLELLVVVVIIAALAVLVVPQLSGVSDDAEKTVTLASMTALRDGLMGSASHPGLVQDMKFVPGFSSVRLRIHHLFAGEGLEPFSVETGRGWRGPYVRASSGVANVNPERSGRFPAPGEIRYVGDTNFQGRGFFTGAYGNTDDLAAADAWGNPIILQIPPPDSFPDLSTETQRFSYARLVSAGPDGYLSTPNNPLAGRDPEGVADRGDDLVLFLTRPDVYEPGL
jgi:prepilin-type N-terminal cleavage/methylation domain-containing protein